MNAVISGRAGVAILVERDRLFSIDVNEPDVRVPRRADEVRYLLGEGRDLQFVEDVAFDEVQRRLEEDTSAEEALHLALIEIPLLREPVNALRVHAFGMLGQSDQAVEAYGRLSPVATPLVRELFDELHRRFVANDVAQHNDDWLIEREIDYVLGRAA